MNLHEYQAKKLLQQKKVAIPPFEIVRVQEEVRPALKRLGISEAVLKIQVHAGGRGKAGGVKVGKSEDEIEALASELIGMKMVNQQTGSEGVIASRVMIAPLIDIEKEYYLAITIDRASRQVILIASPEGGMDIEEVAEKNPNAILKLPVPSSGKLRKHHLLDLCRHMGWKSDIARQGEELAQELVDAFFHWDGALLEVNPLVLDKEEKLWVLDTKLSVDDNALFRHPELSEFFDPTQMPKQEVAAGKHDLAYIALEGNIGCMVNGAGLAMATMDIIKHYGGLPANFLDVGGSATTEKVAAGFEILMSDPNVKAILVNIFGGIMSCATIANGIIEAANKIKLSVPLVVRMEGTSVDEGRELIANSGLDIITANDLGEAAKKAVEAAKKSVGV